MKQPLEAIFLFLQSALKQEHGCRQCSAVMRITKLRSLRCAESPQPGSTALWLVGSLQVMTYGLAQL